MQSVVETTFESHGRTLVAARALPDGEGPFPGVVVLHESWGLNDDMREVCLRFADHGYAAIAPDLLSGGNRWLCLAKLFLESNNPTRALDDIEAARVALAEVPAVDAERMAVIGFCLGGGYALAFGRRGTVQAAAVNYGAVGPKPEDVRDVCPVVASYGGKDRIFAPMGRRLEKHLAAAGVEHDVKVYEDAGHSFMTKGGGPAWVAQIPTVMHVGYVPDAADDAWRRTFAFLDERLGITPA